MIASFRACAAGFFVAAAVCAGGGTLVAQGRTARPAGPPAAADGPKRPLQQYESPYYTIHSDLEPNLVREAYARLTAMAEEYHERTKGFSGAVRSRLPFYLFRREEDYHQAGGPEKSSGVFTGGKLMAVAENRAPAGLWHTVQHEGFHQFAHAVISGRLPVWLDEGLAEYFGEGIWTGDGMVTGVIPPGRLQRVRRLVRDGNLMPLADMMDLDHKTWNGALSSRNYDQAWSMVQFLVSADGGKYRQAFTDYINDVARGGSPALSFQNRFGRDTRAFQSRYEQWWKGLGDMPTADLYSQAAVAAMTSFLARGQVLKMKFATTDDFLQAVRDERIQIDGSKMPRLWLPTSLGRQAMGTGSRLGEWSLPEGKPPRVVLRQPDGAVFTGTFTLDGDGPPKIKVTVERPKPAATAPATKATR